MSSSGRPTGSAWSRAARQSPPRLRGCSLPWALLRRTAARFDRGLVRDIQAQLFGDRNQVKSGRELATLGASRSAQDRHWRRPMKRFAPLALLGLALAAATAPANAQTPTDKSVVKLDPALDALVSPD